METENLERTKGMSSEDIDKLTAEETPEETSLPAETETETEPEVQEEAPSPDDKAQKGMESAIAEQREKRRTAEEDASALRDRVTELEERLRTAQRTPVQPEPTPGIPAVPQSPLEKFNAENEGYSPDAATMKAEIAYQLDQERKKQLTDEQRRIANDAQISEGRLAVEMSPEKMGQGLDIKTVTTVGSQYLTAGDNLDIKNILMARGAEAALKEGYKQCLHRILESGTNDALLLQAAMNAHKSQGKTEEKPKGDGQPPPGGGEPSNDEPEINVRASTRNLSDYMFED